MIVYLGCVENMFMGIEMRYGLLSGWYGRFLIGASMNFVVFNWSQVKSGGVGSVMQVFWCIC